jgi:hypothetical protein
MPEINVHGQAGKLGSEDDKDRVYRKGARDSDSGSGLDLGLGSKGTRQDLAGSLRVYSGVIKEAARSLRAEAEHFRGVFREGARALRGAADYKAGNYKRGRSLAEYENTNSDKAYKRDRWLAEYEHRDLETAWRRTRQAAEQENRDFDAKKRWQEKYAKGQFSKWQALGNFNANFAELQAERQAAQANRPGFVGRAVLGGAQIFGGTRMRNAAATAFGIGGGGRGGGRGIGGGGRGGGRGGGVGAAMARAGGPLGGGGPGMEDEELAAAGMATGIGAAVYVGYEVAKKVEKVVKAVMFAPQTLSAMTSSILSAAKPYTDLIQGAAIVGRSGRFAGGELADALFPREGTPEHGHVPEWMRLRGITPESGMGVINEFGMPISSGDEGKRIIRSAFDFSLDTGVAPNVGAQSLGLLQRLGLRRGGDTGGAVAHDEEYWREYRKNTSAAISLGFDGTEAMGTINRLLSAAVSMGAPSVSLGSTSDYWYRMFSSGTPSARTGELQLSSMEAGHRTALGTGYGGDVVANMNLYNRYAASKGVPPTKEQMLSDLHIDKSQLDDPNNDVMRKIVDDAWGVAQLVQQGKASPADYYLASQELWGGNAAAIAIENAIKAGTVPYPPSDSRYAPMLAKASEQSLTAVDAYLTGHTTRPIPQGGYTNLMGGAVDPNDAHNPFNLKYNKYDPFAAGVRDITNKKTGEVSHYGAYSTDAAGVAAAERQLLVDRNEHGTKTLRQLITRWSPPYENDTEAIISRVSQRSGINPDVDFDPTDQTKAAAFMNAWKQEETPGPFQPGAVEHGVAAGIAASRNNLGEAQAALAYGGQAPVISAEAAFNTIKEGMEKLANPLLAFAGTVETFDHAVLKFANSVADFVAHGAKGKMLLNQYDRPDVDITGGGPLGMWMVPTSKSNVPSVP